MLYSDHNRPNAAYMHTPYLWSPFYIDSQSTIQSVFYLKFGLFVYFVVDFFFSSNTLSNEHTYTMLSISSCLCLNAFQVVFLRLLLCCNVNFIQVSLFVWKEWNFMRFYFMFFSSLSFNFWIFTRKKCVPYTYRCFLLLLHFHFLKKTYAYNSLLIKTIMTMTTATTTSISFISMIRSYVTVVYLYREMMLECAVTFRHI